jgi:hypothetical protein
MIGRDTSLGQRMLEETVTYLRDLALWCTRLAHDCPDLATSQALEGIGTELMEKAKELEQSTPERALSAAPAAYS